ncbi:M16 family metallopeptidase [Nocardiopsis changdeensis]|uniref:Insulinase family protein n=1 Tax=Nocardiopsis changdeensis TaxID=2831969 RepID=A0ABX8BQP8_9ACTN|nr:MULTISPECIES: pitrilysin family protein [Nocardiopsis]QUX23166.1 insulinase family protein [Nocardiopsis changdeensis]QYX39109.1 insulinase family protein [Nocardiopsis sp. MT53]
MRVHDLRSRTLPNGLRVCCLPHGDTPLAELRMVVPGTSRTPGELFRAQLRASLAVLHTGAGDTSREDLESSAVEVHGSASPWATVLSGGCGTADLDRTLRYLAEAVRSPDIDPGEAEREYGRQRALLEASAAYPQHRAVDGLYRGLYGDHLAGNRAGAGRHPLPAEPSAEDLRVPAGTWGPREAMLLVVGGSLDAEEVFAAVHRAFGGWDSPAPGWVVPPVPALAPGAPAVVHVPGTDRAHVRLRADAVSSEDDRYAPLFLALNTLSGGAVSTRLSRNLRNDHGYVYGVNAYVDSFPGANLIAVEAETAAATAGPVLAGIAEELSGMVLDPPTEEEFRAAQRFAAGCMRTRLTSLAEVTGSLMDMALNGEDPMRLADFADQLARVTHDEVVDVSREFFRPERFTGIVCGDASLLGTPEPLTAPTTPHQPAEEVVL